MIDKLQLLMDIDEGELSSQGGAIFSHSPKCVLHKESLALSWEVIPCMNEVNTKQEEFIKLYSIITLLLYTKSQ